MITQITTTWKNYWDDSIGVNKLDNDESDSRCQSLTPQEIAVIMPELLRDEANENKKARKIAWMQFVMTLVSAGATYGATGSKQLAIAVVWGGLISVTNSAILAWRMGHSTVQTALSPQYQVRLLYFYAAERFVVVVALLCLCMAALRLSPSGLIGGFLVIQGLQLIGRWLMGSFKTGVKTKNV